MRPPFSIDAAISRPELAAIQSWGWNRSQSVRLRLEKLVHAGIVPDNCQRNWLAQAVDGRACTGVLAIDRRLRGGRRQHTGTEERLRCSAELLVADACLRRRLCRADGHGDIGRVDGPGHLGLFFNPQAGRFDVGVNQAAQEMDLVDMPTAVPEPTVLLLSAAAGIG